MYYWRVGKITSMNFSVVKLYFTLYHNIPTFNNPEKGLFENIVGIEENAGYQNFSSSPTMFILSSANFAISITFICHLQMLLI